MPGPSLRLISTPSAAERLAAARAFVVAQADAGRDVLIVGATRAAADELAFAVARDRGALFGVQRTSFSELVTKLALPVLAEDGVSPGGALGAEAVATRVAFDALAAGELRYFAPVADLPGFPRATARTLADLQAAGIDSGRLARLDDAGHDLAALLTRAESESRKAGAIARADVLAAATSRLRTVPGAVGTRAVVLLDVPVVSLAEETLVRALSAHVSGDRRSPNATPSILSIAQYGDVGSLAAYARLGFSAGESTPASREATRPLDHDAAPALQRLSYWLFAQGQPPAGEVDDSVEVFSAPGEGREAVEIARRVLREAERGVPFDEMAVLLRAPQSYFGLVEHAFSRAGIPVWFERGTRRPDPAGRAFLALLACADEGLSARRFAEYLSLGQVPTAGVAEGHVHTAAAAAAAGLAGPAPPRDASPPEVTRPADPPREAATGQLSLFDLPTDDIVAALLPPDQRAEDPEPLAEAPPPGERDAAGQVVAGTLRAPWRWEELLVETKVIGGADRWQRRLPGLRREYERRLRELADDDHDSPRLAALERDARELQHLEDFALPVVGQLDGWREPRRWGEWLAQFEHLVPRVLRQPARVVRVLGEMGPLASVGPVTLREVREVLAPRLLTLTHEPPRRRHGRVFVGTPQAARGRHFRVVFVPGLAERLFPQRLREDALLLDARRRAVDPRLATNDARADDERLQLRLAVGAATERLHLSYPRVELRESRPRVPSFYVLDVLRATTGAIPRYKALADQAFVNGRASLAWPAPPDPAQAIDDFEHDLATLFPLLRAPAAQRDRVKGQARYLLDLNPALRRSVTERWARWQSGTHPADGLNRVVELTRPALERARLTARPYSLTALQRFATCPYQFQLAAIYRLAPLEEPAPLQKLDPLTKGSLFHEIQTEFLRKLQQNGMLPVSPKREPAARQMLEWAIGAVTERAYDDLAPAIDRVWKDEIGAMRRDLQVWLEQLVRDGERWVPERFEFAFGLPDDPNRDPGSIAEPARVGEQGFLLRGSIDLVERRVDGAALRVTDHKTGRNRTTLATVIDGGRVLQPVLYGVALEAITGETVAEGRLSFCTTAGNFSDHPIALDPVIRRRGLEVLEIIDRAVEHGTLAPRPGQMYGHRACDFCDFRTVCGPDEATRTLRKPGLPDLEQLRKYS